MQSPQEFSDRTCHRQYQASQHCSLELPSGPPARLPPPPPVCPLAPRPYTLWPGHSGEGTGEVLGALSAEFCPRGFTPYWLPLCGPVTWPCPPTEQTASLPGWCKEARVRVGGVRVRFIRVRVGPVLELGLQLGLDVG